MGLKNPSLRNLFGLRAKQPTVIAIGGNSLTSQQEKGLEEATARNIVELAKLGQVVITHGNGPQVGEKLNQAEEAGCEKSINMATRETQQEIGDIISKHIMHQAKNSGLSYPTIIQTRVIVNPKDSAFQQPTKYIGKTYPKRRIQSLLKDRGDGTYEWEEADIVWIMKEVPGKPGVLRRVVPSPKPINIYPDDLNLINKEIAAGNIVIALGGGGIPIFHNEMPAEAVIDKDLATALLCREIRARQLIIPTGEPFVAHDYRKPAQKNILYYWLQHALENLHQGEYPAGEMGEKIEAAINALRFGVNQVLITSPETSWINNEGTIITRGADLSGRIHNFKRRLGMASNELERWLVS